MSRLREGAHVLGHGCALIEICFKRVWDTLGTCVGQVWEMFWDACSQPVQSTPKGNVELIFIMPGIPQPRAKSVACAIEYKSLNLEEGARLV